MKTKLLAIITIFAAAFTGFSQEKTGWDNWAQLIGIWAGEGSGQPGQGGGSFTFSFDLDKKIIIRKSHSEYPAANNKPGIIHDDLMVIYPGTGSEPAKAIYFDNESHVINYTVTYAEKDIILTSNKSPNAPVFRLTYSFLNTDTVNVKFEMSQDGEKFTTYIEGISKRQKTR